ncbi:hypothetical protein E2C01_064732 [Portunus trituberculatus]|uniref:Uncharacterized protein n=1 Tax=Portunus trituberculatus TaxID=210409 RepID=A0A5B7HGX6_PORTR|nr:hypothetical protein [Portunus trituberculatus]
MSISESMCTLALLAGSRSAPPYNPQQQIYRSKREKNDKGLHSDHNNEEDSECRDKREPTHALHESSMAT